MGSLLWRQWMNFPERDHRDLCLLGSCLLLEHCVSECVCVWVCVRAECFVVEQNAKPPGSSHPASIYNHSTLETLLYVWVHVCVWWCTCVVCASVCARVWCVCLCMCVCDVCICVCVLGWVNVCVKIPNQGLHSSLAGGRTGGYTGALQEFGPHKKEKISFFNLLGSLSVRGP